MKQFLLASTLLVALVPMATTHAAPITGNFTVNVWNGNGGGTITSPGVQALPGNPLATGPNRVVPTFTYTGAIDFTTNVNSIGAFLLSAGGTITGLNAQQTGVLNSTTLSLPNFTNTSFIQITGLTNAVTGTLTNDDGVSLYQNGVNVIPVSASAPTNEVSTPFTLAAGSFDLYYVEANGLPARLTMDVTPIRVPEPASLALFGAGLLGLGVARRRRA